MWIIIIALLAIGLALVIAELVFIPGTTIVGVLGLVFSIAGIVICYKHFGSDTGFYILMGMLLTTALAIVYSFRSNSWSKFSLKTSMNSRVNEGMLAALNVGDQGKTISTLRPFGKAEFGLAQFEVKTMGDYIEPGQSIRIKQINSHQIIVEPIN